MGFRRTYFDAKQTISHCPSTWTVVAKISQNFAFQLSDDKIEIFESQNATQKSILLGRRGEMPWAYTLEGCNMVATVLNTPLDI